MPGCPLAWSLQYKVPVASVTPGPCRYGRLLNVTKSKWTWPEGSRGRGTKLKWLATPWALFTSILRGDSADVIVWGHCLRCHHDTASVFGLHVTRDHHPDRLYPRSLGDTCGSFMVDWLQCICMECINHPSEATFIYQTHQHVNMYHMLLSQL